MPRTVEEILAHADELSSRFESYEPDPSDEIDVEAIHALRVSARLVDKGAARIVP